MDIVRGAGAYITYSTWGTISERCLAHIYIVTTVGSGLTRHDSELALIVRCSYPLCSWDISLFFLVRFAKVVRKPVVNQNPSLNSRSFFKMKKLPSSHQGHYFRNTPAKCPGGASWRWQFSVAYTRSLLRCDIYFKEQTRPYELIRESVKPSLVCWVQWGMTVITIWLPLYQRYHLIGTQLVLLDLRKWFGVFKI